MHVAERVGQAQRVDSVRGHRQARWASGRVCVGIGVGVGRACMGVAERVGRAQRVCMGIGERGGRAQRAGRPARRAWSMSSSLVDIVGRGAGRARR